MASASATHRELPPFLDSVAGPSRFRLGAALRRAWATDLLLTVVGLAMLVTLAGVLIGLIVDPRVVTGAPAWLKPAKFAISISIYSFTFLWLLRFVAGHPRLVRVAAVMTGIAFVVEMVIVAGQAARGRASHFNISTPLDEFLYTRMRDFVIVIFLMNVLIAVLLLRQRLPDPVFAWSVRLGILLSLVGMGVAVLMTVPNPATAAAWEAGYAGAHSVGVADGGPGLPIVGWSTVGGDLRAPHFVGLHALQIMPFVGWLLTRWRPGSPVQRERLVMMATAGFAYLGLVLILTWQALRGQPIVAPDRATVSGLALLLAMVVVVVAGALARATRLAPAAEAAAA